MLSSEKLREISKARNVDIEQLASRIVQSGRSKQQAVSAVKNWQKGLYKPAPTKEDIDKLARVLSVDANELSDWKSSYRYAPISARKARLVTALISGRNVQDAMDILKFTRKRAASMIDKVLKSAIADADEQQADVESLYISSARVDEAGVRIGTKRWIAKDRGRAHPIRKRASHIHITVTQE